MLHKINYIYLLHNVNNNILFIGIGAILQLKKYDIKNWKQNKNITRFVFANKYCLDQIAAPQVNYRFKYKRLLNYFEDS